MRGTDLLGLPVVGPDGPLGCVLDLRLVQDGPLMGAFAALRVSGLVIGRRQLAAHFGYDRQSAHGPAALRALARWWLRPNRFVAWSAASVEDGQVRVQNLSALVPVPEI